MPMYLIVVCHVVLIFWFVRCWYLVGVMVVVCKYSFPGVFRLLAMTTEFKYVNSSVMFLEPVLNSRFLQYVRPVLNVTGSPERDYYGEF